VRAVEPLERAGRAFVKNFGLVIARNESTTRDEKKFRKYTLCSKYCKCNFKFTITAVIN